QGSGVGSFAIWLFDNEGARKHRQGLSRRDVGPAAGRRIALFGGLGIAPAKRAASTASAANGCRQPLGPRQRVFKTGRARAGLGSRVVSRLQWGELTMRLDYGKGISTRFHDADSRGC